MAVQPETSYWLRKFEKTESVDGTTKTNTFQYRDWKINSQKLHQDETGNNVLKETPTRDNGRLPDCSQID
jgi:hypothetical protein